MWHWLLTVVDVVCALLALAGWHCQRRLRAAVALPVRMVSPTKVPQKKEKGSPTLRRLSRVLPARLVIVHVWHWLPAVVDVVCVLALAGGRC